MIDCFGFKLNILVEHKSLNNHTIKLYTIQHITKQKTKRQKPFRREASAKALQMYFESITFKSFTSAKKGWTLLFLITFIGFQKIIHLNVCTFCTYLSQNDIRNSVRPYSGFVFGSLQWLQLQNEYCEPSKRLLCSSSSSSAVSSSDIESMSKSLS